MPPLFTMKYLIVLLLISYSFPKDTLTVVVSPFEPLIIHHDNGSISGYDIDMWNMISDKLDIHTNYMVVNDLKDIFNYVKEKKADLSIAGITITHAREIEFDFSYPYKKSGLTILIRNEKEFNIFKALIELFKGSFLTVCTFLILYIILIAHLIWFGERGSDAFDDKYWIGIKQALWWAVVTVTTVGYGDKVPKKGFSQIIAGVSMFLGIGLAGLVMSQLTIITQLQISNYDINTIKDIKGKNIAIVKNTTSEKCVRQYGGNTILTETIKEAILMLEAKKVDGVISDAPVLQFEAKNNPNLITVGGMFDLQDYGILLPDSKLKEKISRAVLSIIETEKYSEINQKWFGE